MFWIFTVLGESSSAMKNNVSILLTDAEVPKINAPLPVFVQQAAAAKTIG